MIRKATTLLLAHEGMKKGAKTGLYLSLAYDLLFPFIYFYTDPSVQKVAPPVGGMIASSFVIPLYGLIVGCVPAVIIGAITGWIVGKIFTMLQTKLTAFGSLLIGFGISVMITLVVNSFILLNSIQPLLLLQSYLYLIYLGIPTLVYIVATPVKSYQFYRQNSTCFTRQK